jgi:hypothetical protein
LRVKVTEDYKEALTFKESQEFVVEQPVKWKTLRGPMPDIPAWAKV